MKWICDHNGDMVCGDYVMTMARNSFNNKSSYWISKKNYTVAFYCFSHISDSDTAKQMDNPQVWIDYFENRIKKLED